MMVQSGDRTTKTVSRRPEPLLRRTLSYVRLMAWAVRLSVLLSVVCL